MGCNGLNQRVVSSFDNYGFKIERVLASVFPQRKKAQNMKQVVCAPFITMIGHFTMEL